MTRYVPPVGFYFAMIIQGKGGSTNKNHLDSAFQEVKGLSYKMEVDKIVEGGENRFVHKVPGRVTFDDLVLTRGLMVAKSPIGKWCRKHLSSGLSQKIEPKNLTLMLLDRVMEVPIMSWNFCNAFPTSWQVSDFNAENSSIVIETLQLSYSYFTVEDESMGANMYWVKNTSR
jgi:phage tail-like protein